VATWEVTVFDSETEELIEAFDVHGIDLRQVSAIWEFPPGVTPTGDQRITEREIGSLNDLLDRQLSLRAGQALFLGLRSDYPGEVVEEL